MKLNILIFAFSFFIFNEAPAQNLKESDITLVGFSKDINSKNYALLFTMTDEQGRTRNLDLMEDVFKDKKLGFVHKRFHNFSSKEIYEKVKEYTPKVGENGTLLVYLNSHGGGSGRNFGMQAREGFFKFSKLISTISSVGKVDRLVVLIDTCHAAGGIEEGFDTRGVPLKTFNKIINMPDLKYNIYFKNFFETKDGNFDYCVEFDAYNEALIIASSSPEKLSNRGTFATNFKKAKEETKSNCTVVEFLKLFASFHPVGGQIPYFKCIPNNSILNEPLFSNPIAREIPIKNEKNKNFILIPDFEFKSN
jgi:hypothetical protein